MAITTTEAAAALRDISAADARSREFKGYRRGAPYFLLWGIIWVVGYGLAGLSPRYGVAWFPLSLIGSIASAVIGRRQRRRESDRGAARATLRYAGTCFAYLLFLIAAYAVLPPHEPNQLCAFPALFIGTMYLMAGIWIYQRYLWVGMVLIVATLGGYFLLAPWFSYWLAVVGGGALILTGLWMRKA